MGAHQAWLRGPGQPRKHDEHNLKYLGHTDLSARLWQHDYRPLVAAAIAEHPDLAAEIQRHLDNAPGHYRRLLASNPDPSKLLAYEQKMDVQIAEHLETLDGMASQKCRSVLKEARGIAFKLGGMSMAQVKIKVKTGSHGGGHG